MVPDDLALSDDESLLPECLSRFPGLVQDLAHWHGYGVRTPRALGDYLDVACAVNVYKSEFGVKPNFTSVEEAREYLSAEARR